MNKHSQKLTSKNSSKPINKAIKSTPKRHLRTRAATSPYNNKQPRYATTSSRHSTQTSPSSISSSQLRITPHTIISNPYSTPALHQTQQITTTRSVFSSSPRFISTTPHHQHTPQHLTQTASQTPSAVQIQNASFFTSALGLLKSKFQSATNPTPSQSTTTNPDTSPVFRELLNIDTKTQYKHVQDVMVNFRAFLAKRPGGESAPITDEDKATYVQTWTPEQLQSIQMDASSAHFFHVPKIDVSFAQQADRPSNATKEKFAEGIQRIPVSISKDDPRYAEMMANNAQRYHDGELNARYEQRKAQMLKDALETDVYHIDPDKLEHDMMNVSRLQDQYENNPNFDPKSITSNHHIPELKIIQKPDGSFGFEDDVDTTSSGSAKQPGTTFTPRLDEHGNQVKVPVTGESIAIGQINDPRMLISFICDVCNTRNVKSIPKRSYQRGVVLIRCKCEADHLISDSLGWFDDSGQLTIEKIMEQDKGEKVFKASVLDLNKPIQNMDHFRENSASAAGQKSLQGEELLSDNHISPEMYNKIQETIRIAREQDKKQAPQFQHFYHEDKLYEQIANQPVPLLPAGKTHTSAHSVDGERKM